MQTERTFDDILASIGTRSPDVPGSTASILAGLLGLSMAKMSILVSKNHSTSRAILEKIERLSRDLLDAAERDRSNCLRYLDTLREHRPRKEEQVSVCALREVEIGATKPPLQAARLIVETLEVLDEISSSVDHSVASDLHAGAVILNASFAGVMMAVNINLEPDHMKDMRKHTAAERAGLAARRDIAFAALKRAAERQGFQY